MTAIIASPEELSALRAWRARRGIRRVALRYAGDEALLRRTESSINRALRAACGCDLGAIFVAAGVVVALIARPGWLATPVLLFGCAIVGKATGMIAAELRLRRAIDLATRPPSRPRR